MKLLELGIRGGVVVLAVLALVACNEAEDVSNHGALVGGACVDSRDCEGVCLRGGRFPEGTCSVECRDDEDCPLGTACIDREGGVCLLLCDRHGDCRGGYSCDDQDRRGRGGQEYVCIND
jgi:hypothetical protein